MLQILKMLLLLCLAVLTSAQTLKLDFTRATVQNKHINRRDLNLPLYNDLLQQKYVINLTVGTPPQPIAVLADTGSADLWAPAINSSGCLPNPCPPGSFVPADSSTNVETGLIFNASYGLTADLDIVGKYYNDTVRLGDAVLPNYTGRCDGSFAVGDVTKVFFDVGFWGILGLGSRYAEAIYPKAVFPTIYDRLKESGIIDKRLFSIWLNDITATTGSILFGGIDHTEYTGELRTVPVVVSSSTQLFRDWAVNLTSVTYLNGTSGESQSLTADDFEITTVLDSGSPNMYLPTNLANSVASLMNATTYQGFSYVSCAVRKSHESLALQLGNSSTGPRIVIPFGEIIYPFGNPANLGNVTADDGTQLCYLGLIGNPGPIFLLGDTFIRSAYVVYDADNQEVSMAPVKYNSGYGDLRVET